MLKFKDIVLLIKDLFKMNSVYDCVRPFLLVSGIFGIGGSKLIEIEGVRSVRNTKFSSLIAMLIAFVITPFYFIYYFNKLFYDKPRTLYESTNLIIAVGKYAFIIFTTAVACIQTHVYCKKLTKVLQILDNTDMMLKQENIHENYWRIILKTILLGLISCNYFQLKCGVYWINKMTSVYNYPGAFTVRLLWLVIDIACEYYFIWPILFMVIIHERFVGLNKLLLQNAQVPSIVQDDSLLRRISVARDIHEQLSEVIVVFSDISRFIIIGVLVPGMLASLWTALTEAAHWNELVVGADGNTGVTRVLLNLWTIVLPIMKIVTLTGLCESHKNNRRVHAARLRYLISREEDPRIVQQLREYIWFNHETVAGLVDFQLVDVDFTLLFMVIDIVASYMFVIYSYFR